MSEDDLSLIEDLPKGGPLQKYREASSFNWKKMKLFFESMDLIKYKVFFSTIKSNGYIIQKCIELFLLK